MESYKKKSLKFNSEVRREIRHAETVKARETSRFKRLSMLRCIEEEQQSKPVKKTIQEVKKPVSRLEILQKWKHEKIVKKELEKKNSIRPFYAGASSLTSANKGASKIGNCNQSSVNISTISKKGSSSISNPISKIPNISKQVSCNSIPTSRIPSTSRQVSYSANLTSRTVKGLKPPGVIAKATTITQPQLQKNPGSNRELAKKPAELRNNPKTNKVPPKSEIQTGASSATLSVNAGSSKGFQSRIAKPCSVVPRRNLVQSKLPAISNQKPAAALSKKNLPVSTIGVKLPASSSSQKPTTGCLNKPAYVSKIDLKKTPVPENQKQDKKPFPESAANRSTKPSSGKIIPGEKSQPEPTCSADSELKSGSERNVENLSEIFECDVSMIKPLSSFAPENFMFQPPSEVLDYSFDFSILRKIKEFTSRTSTPTKAPVKNTDEGDKEIIQEPIKNKAVEIEIFTTPKQSAQSSTKNEDDKEIMQNVSPSECLDIETNISTQSKQNIEVSKSDEDYKETMHELEDVDIKDDIITSKADQNQEEGNEIVQKSSENVENDVNLITSKADQDCKNHADGNEIVQRPSENVKNDIDIITSKPDQESENHEDDNEIVQKSSGNVENDIDIVCPSEDFDQDPEKISKTSLQDSSNSFQPLYPTSVTTDENVLLKDGENVGAKTDQIIYLPSNGEVNTEKFKQSHQLNVFNNTFQKRRSIFKKSTLNSIAEKEDILSPSPVKDASGNKENILVKMPRRSRRISNLISIEESPSSTPRQSCRISNLICIDESPSTPRRSLRLQKKVSKKNQQDDSNPECSTNHTNLTNDFDKLALEDFDDMNPDDYLCDFDVFDSPEKRKSRKISLLYSPDKRRSMRRSIRGDLMSFSPNNSPRF